MSNHTTQAVYYSRSFPELPTFPEPPQTISGEELAKMVPPVPTISDIDFSQIFISSDEEEEDLEATGQPLSRKKSRSQTNKCSTKVAAKSDSTRGRAQKKRAASAQAKKAVVVSRNNGVKKARI